MSQQFNDGTSSGIPISHYAVWGDTSAGYGAVGTSALGTGVWGLSTSGIGVSGSSDTSIAVLGWSGTSAGVAGYSGSNFGVYGRGANAGVVALNLNNQNAAYLASGCCAAWFTGEVVVSGPLFKNGGGFRIDHPLDPGGKYLTHSFVESPDMKNIYDGIAVLDPKGQAEVKLPAWFQALNNDFRYQLTPVGASGPGLHIAQEIAENRFRIAGGAPGMKVSWQVTGARADAWANAHRIEVERDKPGEERGRYLNPQLHNQPEDKAVDWALRSARRMRPKELEKPVFPHPPKN